MKKIILTESQVERMMGELVEQSSINRYVNDTIKNSPLHVYCAIRFLNRQTSTLTEREIKRETLANLSKILCEKAMRMGSCDPSKWPGNDPRSKPNKNSLGYNDFTTLYSKSPSYKGTSFSYGSQPIFIQELMLTLGRATITSTGSGWHVKDYYNFDNIMEKKPHLKTDSYFKMGLNVVRGIGAAIGGWILGKSPVNGIEEVMSQLHNTGYKGFPVELNVPSNGCKCKR